jgi:hypothetical protein
MSPGLHAFYAIAAGLDYTLELRRRSHHKVGILLYELSKPSFLLACPFEAMNHVESDRFAEAACGFEPVTDLTRKSKMFLPGGSYAHNVLGFGSILRAAERRTGGCTPD